MFTFITALIANDGQILCSIMFSQDKRTPYIDFSGLLPHSPGAALMPCVRVPDGWGDAATLAADYSEEVADAAQAERQYNRPGDAEYLAAVELRWRVFKTLAECESCGAPFGDLFDGIDCRVCAYVTAQD